MNILVQQLCEVATGYNSFLSPWKWQDITISLKKRKVTFQLLPMFELRININQIILKQSQHRY